MFFYYYIKLYSFKSAQSETSSIGLLKRHHACRHLPSFPYISASLYCSCFSGLEPLLNTGCYSFHHTMTGIHGCELFIPFCLWSHSSLDPEFNPVQKCSNVHLCLPTRGPATGQQIWNLVFSTQSFYSLPLTYTVHRGPVSYRELVALTPVSMQSGINLMQRSVNFFPGSGLCTERSQWRIKAKDGKWLITFPGKAVCQDLLFQFIMLSSSQSVVGPADSAKLNFKTRTDVQMELK